MKKIIVIALILSLWVHGTALAEQIIIVNKGVSINSVDSDTLKKIYLGKKSKWDNGDKIVPVNLNEGPVHENFIKNVVNKSTSQYVTYWKRMIFTGKGIPPKSVPTETDIVNFVSNTSGAIGYIDSATPHDAVKVVQMN